MISPLAHCPRWRSPLPARHARTPRNFQIKEILEVQPELGVRVEVSCQAKRGFRPESAPLVHDRFAHGTQWPSRRTKQIPIDHGYELTARSHQLPTRSERLSCSIPFISAGEERAMHALSSLVRRHSLERRSGMQFIRTADSGRGTSPIRSNATVVCYTGMKYLKASGAKFTTGGAALHGDPVEAGK
jgi:hypothetical protein